MKAIFPIIALIGLALTLAPSLIHLFGSLDLKTALNLMTAGMILWFIGGIPWLALKKNGHDKSSQDHI